jgi:hypothetical protein
MGPTRTTSAAFQAAADAYHDAQLAWRAEYNAPPHPLGSPEQRAAARRLDRASDALVDARRTMDAAIGGGP